MTDTRPFHWAPVILAALLCGLLLPLPFAGDLRRNIPLFCWVSLASVLILYIGIWFLRRRGIAVGRGMVLSVALLLRLVTFPMLPSLSDDAYRYVWDGRLVLHGISPYRYLPVDTALAVFHDELFRLQGYPVTHTIYPPLTQLVFAAGAGAGRLMGGSADWRYGYYSIKALMTLAELTAILLLLRLLKRRGRPAGDAILYAWHPLAVIELSGQGHTDALWVAGILLALYAVQSGWRDRGFGALLAGTAARLFPIALIPLWFRGADRRALLYGGLGCLVVIAMFLALLTGPGALAGYLESGMRYTNYYEFNGGFYLLVKWLADQTGAVPSNRVAGALIGVIQAVLVLWIWWKGWQQGRGPDYTVRVLPGLVLWLISVQIVLPAKVHVWYFTAPLCLLPLVSSRHPLRGAWLWAALIGPLTYLAYRTPEFTEQHWVTALEWAGFGLIAIISMLHASGRGMGTGM